MRILIIAVPRTGSTSLAINIGKENYHEIHEPYNPILDGYEKNLYPNKEIDKDRLVVKHTISDEPHEKYVKFKSNIHLLIDYVKYFDKVILLDRKISQEHLESFLSLKYTQEQKVSSHSRWELSTIPTEWIDNHMLEYKKELDILKSEIESLSKIIDIPITYYEDLYGEDRIHSFEIINKWELDLDPFQLNEYLHPSNRYRITKKSTI